MRSPRAEEDPSEVDRCWLANQLTAEELEDDEEERLATRAEQRRQLLWRLHNSVWPP